MPLHTDILIIGQGLAGSLLAFELQKEGADFLVAANPDYTGASRVAPGMFNPLVFKRMKKSWMADDLLPVMHHTYAALEKLLKTPIIFRKNILKPLNSQEISLWEQKLLQKNYREYILSIRKGIHIEGLKSFPAFGEITQSGFVNAGLFLERFSEYLLQHKKLIRDNVRYKDIKAGKNFVSWKDVTCNTLVFCEGAYTVHNPFFSFVTYYYTKGDVLWLYAKNLPEDYIITKQAYLIPLGNHLFRAGSTYKRDFQDDKPDSNASAEIIHHLQEFMDIPFSIKGHYAAIRPTVKDRRPVLGIHPEMPRLLYFNGLGTKGVMLAPYFAGEMVKILKNPSFQINPEVNLTRFIH